jgi:hypothetical protein
VRSRVDLAARKLGYADASERHCLDTDLFRPPAAAAQLTLGL